MQSTYASDSFVHADIHPDIPHVLAVAQSVPSVAPTSAAAATTSADRDFQFSTQYSTP